MPQQPRLPTAPQSGASPLGVAWRAETLQRAGTISETKERYKKVTFKILQTLILIKLNTSSLEKDKAQELSQLVAKLA